MSRRRTFKVRPPATTSYRLRSPSGATAPVKVAVTPVLRFAQTHPAGSLRGTMEPVISGKVVRVQRRSGGTWRTLATTRVRATGVWRARFGVSSGVYRAHAPASHGFAGGVSPRLTVIVR